MAEPVLMMSETANPDLIDVSPDCREQICCDSLLPALAQEQVWLAGYSRLKTRYRISRRFADVHCFLLTLGGEGEVQVGDRRERLQAGEWAPTADIPWALGGNITLSRVLSNHMQTAEPYPFLFTDDYCPLDFLDREVRFAWRREKIKAMEMSSWRR